MRTKSIFILAFLFLIGGILNAQIITAHNAYKSFYLQDAIKKYKKILKKDESNAEALLNLAECYRLTGEFSEAERWFEKAVLFNDEASAKLHYAQTLLANEKYDEAAIWFERFSRSTHNANDSRNGKRLAQQCRELAELGLHPGPVVTERVTFNSPSLEFSPSIFDNEYIIFASNRTPGQKEELRNPDPWTDNSFVDLYIAMKDGAHFSEQFHNPTKLDATINTKFHEGPVSVSSSGDVIYFTRNDYFKGKRHYDKEKNTRLNIYRAERLKETEAEWGKIEKMAFNNKNYSSCHPALSPDMSYLVFASDRPGGYGGMDLWITRFDGSNWSEPANLGVEINTSGNEAFPYIGEKEELIFSSDFQVGIGGMDLFRAEKKGRKWIQPTNLGPPINSPKDDFGMALLPGEHRGYFTSNRAGMDDDIYYFYERNVIKVKGIVKDCIDSTEVVAPLVSLEEDGLLDRQMYGDLGGEFETFLDFEHKYILTAEKEGYEINKNCPGSVQLSTYDLVDLDTMEITIWLSRILPPAPPQPIVENLFGKDIKIEAGARIEIHNIYFDLDRSDIRSDAVPSCMVLLELLKKYPNIKGELSAHTDSRGSDAYNLRLSDARAASVFQFLINNGIDPERLTSRGYGETRLRNRCANGIACSEAEHQVNRRVEFEITEMGGEEVDVIKLD